MVSLFWRHGVLLFTVHAGATRWFEAGGEQTHGHALVSAGEVTLCAPGTAKLFHRLNVWILGLCLLNNLGRGRNTSIDGGVYVLILLRCGFARCCAGR